MNCVDLIQIFEMWRWWWWDLMWRLPCFVFRPTATPCKTQHLGRLVRYSTVVLQEDRWIPFAWAEFAKWARQLVQSGQSANWVVHYMHICTTWDWNVPSCSKILTLHGQTICQICVCFTIQCIAMQGHFCVSQFQGFVHDDALLCAMHYALCIHSAPCSADLHNSPCTTHELCTIIYTLCSVPCTMHSALCSSGARVTRCPHFPKFPTKSEPSRRQETAAASRWGSSRLLPGSVLPVEAEMQIILEDGVWNFCLVLGGVDTKSRDNYCTHV